MTFRLVLLALTGAAALLGAAACRPRGTAATRPVADSVDVGYGAQPRDKVVGAVTTLSERDVSVRPLRIEELLRGKVPGLEIIRRGNNLTLRMRSVNSMMLEQEPLIIVDGVLIQEGNVGAALAGLVPDDIKQVNVLKDVASTSIYGSRGAGGVILITTKGKRDDEHR